jgi:hypothetical protein
MSTNDISTNYRVNMIPFQSEEIEMTTFDFGMLGSLAMLWSLAML